jgi:hypothetical protein
VSRIQEFEAAELHERNVAAGEFHFERSAMVRDAKQDRLLFQHGAAFAILQHARDDVVCLVVLVANADELRPLGGGTVGPKVFGEALAREIDDAVGGGEDRLRRAIVPVKRDDCSLRAELSREVEDVAHRRGAKRINRLRVIPDHGKAAPAGLQRQKDRGLKAVRVLVLVDEHMVDRGVKKNSGYEPRRSRQICRSGSI